jgi:diadenosine tetraphosphate (Ap4A) HIT family hydrolase
LNAFELHPDLKRDGIPVGEFPLCLVLLINDSAYPWFVLVPKRDGIKDAIDLVESDYDSLCKESRVFGLAIKEIFDAEKLNVAALGNMTPQLHVHHIVRSQDDPAWPKPIWGFQPLTPYSDAEVEGIRRRLCDAEIASFSPVVKS